MKTCKVCKSQYGLDQFPVDKRNKDGRTGQCIECTKIYKRERRRSRHEHYTKHDRERSKSTKRMVANAVRYKQWKLSNPIKDKAKSLVRSAIRAGILTRKPCVICNNATSYGHHEDYSKPLEVVWLCQIHHRARHDGRLELTHKHFDRSAAQWEGLRSWRSCTLRTSLLDYIRDSRDCPL